MGRTPELSGGCVGGARVAGLGTLPLHPRCCVLSEDIDHMLHSVGIQGGVITKTDFQIVASRSLGAALLPPCPRWPCCSWAASGSGGRLWNARGNDASRSRRGGDLMREGTGQVMKQQVLEFIQRKATDVANAHASDDHVSARASRADQ